MKSESDPPRVTLRDIAARLGLSHSTISRALHGNPEISEQRRRKVQAVAEEMGYRPNAMATALGIQRHRTSQGVSAEIAWINCWKDPGQLHRYKEFQLYWAGAYHKAEQCGYRLEEFLCGGRISPPRLEQILRARNIRALLLPPHRAEDMPAGWDALHWEEFHVVRLGYSVQTPAARIVAGNRHGTGLLVFDNIRRLGYRRIGYIYGNPPVGTLSGFLFRQQMELTPRERLPALDFGSRPDPVEAEARLGTWLQKHRPDAIFTDVGGLGEMLARLGWRVPEDVGLASLSVLDGDADAGVYQNSEHIGAAAVEMLVSLVNHDARGVDAVHRETLVDARWIDGRSLPPRPAATPSDTRRDSFK